MGIFGVIVKFVVAEFMQVDICDSDGIVGVSALETYHLHGVVTKFA